MYSIRDKRLITQFESRLFNEEYLNTWQSVLYILNLEKEYKAYFEELVGEIRDIESLCYESLIKDHCRVVGDINLYDAFDEPLSRNPDYEFMSLEDMLSRPELSEDVDGSDRKRLAIYLDEEGFKKQLDKVNKSRIEVVKSNITASMLLGLLEQAEHGFSDVKNGFEVITDLEEPSISERTKYRRPTLKRWKKLQHSLVEIQKVEVSKNPKLEDYLNIIGVQMHIIAEVFGDDLIKRKKHMNKTESALNMDRYVDLLLLNFKGLMNDVDLSEGMLVSDFEKLDKAGPSKSKLIIKLTESLNSIHDDKNKNRFKGILTKDGGVMIKCLNETLKL